MDQQDWKPVVLRKSRQSASEARKDAVRSGTSYDVQRRFDAGSNKRTGADVNMAKIDADTESLRVKTVDPAVGKAIAQARQRLGKTQKDLATDISERVQIVTEYESGRAQPNQQILTKMERVLKVKLRGSGNIGAPLP